MPSVQAKAARSALDSSTRRLEEARLLHGFLLALSEEVDIKFRFNVHKQKHFIPGMELLRRDDVIDCPKTRSHRTRCRDIKRSTPENADDLQVSLDQAVGIVVHELAREVVLPPQEVANMLVAVFHAAEKSHGGASLIGLQIGAKRYELDSFIRALEQAPALAQKALVQEAGL